MNIYRDIVDQRVLEREYSPSSCVEDLAPFLIEYRRQSDLVRALRDDVRTLQYGANAAESLDYFPVPAIDADTGHSRPVVIYIHGGYWQDLSKDDHSFPATGFNRQGLHYLAINYGLAPQATLEEMVARCRAAIVWISEHATELRIDPLAMHLIGCSAGGHLAAMTTLTDWSIHGLKAPPICSLVLLSAVVDLRPIPLTYVNDIVGMTVETALLNSPLLLVDSAQSPLPRMLVAVGENETSEFKRQSAEFAAAVHRRGGHVSFYCIPDRHHFDLIFDLADESTTLGALVAQQTRTLDMGLMESS